MVVSLNKNYRKIKDSMCFLFNHHFESENMLFVFASSSLNIFLYTASNKPDRYSLLISNNCQKSISLIFVNTVLRGRNLRVTIEMNVCRESPETWCDFSLQAMKVFDLIYVNIPHDIIGCHKSTGPRFDIRHV